MIHLNGARASRARRSAGVAMRLATIISALAVWVALLGVAAPDRPVPDYDARVLGSQRKVDLAELDGVLLLNTWATWCHPCRAEMPALQVIHERYADEGLRVIGINVDETASDGNIAKFAEAIGVTFEIWRDPHNEFAKKFRVLGVPETFLIANGTILRHWRGRMDPIAQKNLAAIKAALGLTTGPRPNQFTTGNSAFAQVPEASPRAPRLEVPLRTCLPLLTVQAFGRPPAPPTMPLADSCTTLCN